MGKRWIMAAALGVGLAGPASATEATIAAGRLIALDGVTPGRPGCSSCHLADGRGQPEVGIPRLAGLTTSILAAQLGYFADGSRRNIAMAPYAKALSAAQRQEVADYYASLVVPPTDDPFPAAAATLAQGGTLFQNGDPGRGLLACAGCHGSTAHGVGDFSPALAGQSAVYVEDKLRQWRSGALRDPGGTFMRAEAGHLTLAQITAVAGYVASLQDQEGPK